jgi:steroid delta-isomerase
VGAGIDLLNRHIERFNVAVRTGDFAPMMDGFADDAEMVFEGVPVGPYQGRDAIVAAYRDRPPDDEVEILEAFEEDDGVVVARYRWRDPTAPAGRMLLTTRGDKIAKLVVTFEPSSAG